MDLQFKNQNEFLNNISRGGETEFEYCGKNYFVGLVANGTYVVSEWNQESTEQHFSSVNAVGECLIAGEMLKDVILKAKILFRCFE